MKIHPIIGGAICGSAFGLTALALSRIWLSCWDDGTSAMQAVWDKPLLSFVEPTYEEVTAVPELEEFLKTAPLSQKQAQVLRGYVGWKLANAYNEGKNCHDKYMIDESGIHVRPEWQREHELLHGRHE